MTFTAGGSTLERARGREGERARDRDDTTMKVSSGEISAETRSKNSGFFALPDSSVIEVFKCSHVERERDREEGETD